MYSSYGHKRVNKHALSNERIMNIVLSILSLSFIFQPLRTLKSEETFRVSTPHDDFLALNKDRMAVENDITIAIVSYGKQAKS